MKKLIITVLLLFILFPCFLNAQEGGDPGYEEDWDVEDTDNYLAGDQTFIISLGTVFPVIFTENGKKISEHNINPVGGTACLIYNYFLTPKIIIGGEVGGFFISTLAKNALYIVPVGIRAGYQFNVWRFDIPIVLTLGMVWHSYMGSTYYGIFGKGGVGVYYRMISSWSFGINANWNWFPEWTKDSAKNADGHFVDLTLGARYHF